MHNIQIIKKLINIFNTNSKQTQIVFILKISRDNKEHKIKTKIGVMEFRSKNCTCSNIIQLIRNKLLQTYYNKFVNQNKESNHNYELKVNRF